MACMEHGTANAKVSTHYPYMFSDYVTAKLFYLNVQTYGILYHMSSLSTYYSVYSIC